MHGNQYWYALGQKVYIIGKLYACMEDQQMALAKINIGIDSSKKEKVRQVKECLEEWNKYDTGMVGTDDCPLSYVVKHLTYSFHCELSANTDQMYSTNNRTGTDICHRSHHSPSICQLSK